MPEHSKGHKQPGNSFAQVGKTVTSFICSASEQGTDRKMGQTIDAL